MSEPITLPEGVFESTRSPEQKAQAKAPAAASSEESSSEGKLPMPGGLTKEEKKIWKLKADGEDFEFDASNEEAIKREIMKARGADKRFKEAAATRQQAEQFFNMLKDPSQLEKVLSDPRIGVDVKKFAEELIWKEIENSQLTPEQKIQRERDLEYEQLKQEKEALRRETDERERNEHLARYEQHYEKNIMKALQSTGVPRDPMTVMRMADYMMNAVKSGYDLTAEEIAMMVKRDNSNYLKTHVNDMDEDQLLEFLGEQLAEKLRKADLKRLRSPTSFSFPERISRQSFAPQEAPSKLSGSDWRASVQSDFLARRR